MKYIIFIIYLPIILIHAKYTSIYYKNYTNILDRGPNIDIDYIFSQNVKTTDNPTSNIFQKIFYDYYHTSVPLYDKKISCYFPTRKNITFSNKTDFYPNSTKFHNISNEYGQIFLKQLKSNCKEFYIERWYYKLCPFIGATQTLSYIKTDERTGKEKKEVNYLGYEFNIRVNEKSFLLSQINDSKIKEYLEDNYKEEITDIREKNLYNNYLNQSLILGVCKNLIKFYEKDAFDIPNLNIIFKLLNETSTQLSFFIEYTINNQKIIRRFETKIISVLNKDLILVDNFLDIHEIHHIYNINKIFISLKKINDQNNVNNKVINYNLFYNKIINVYKNILYSSKFDLLKCKNISCFVSISNDKKIYKVITVINSDYAFLDSKKDIITTDNNLKENIHYAIYFEQNKEMHFAKGSLNKLLLEDNFAIFVGKNIDHDEIEIGDDLIFLIYNNKTEKFKNLYIIEESKYISMKCIHKINSTYYKTEFNNPKDRHYFFDKIAITLEPNFLISKRKYNNNINYIPIIFHQIGKIIENPKYTNQSDISINSNSKHINKIKIMKINNKEFVFNFILESLILNNKNSYVHICFTQKEKCDINTDYELIIDLNNNGIIFKKINENNYTNSTNLIFSIDKNIKHGTKFSVIFFNSSIYVNTISKDRENIISDIKLKYELENQNIEFNNLIINEANSSNILIENLIFDEKLSYDLFKNIFFYNQKFLLDDKGIFVDTFENGDYCKNINAPRRVIINYICDEEGVDDYKITNVYEDKKKVCRYEYYVKTKYLCNPNTVRKNYLKFAELKTYCFEDGK